MMMTHSFPVSSSIVHCNVPMYMSHTFTPPKPLMNFCVFLSSPTKSSLLGDMQTEQRLSIPTTSLSVSKVASSGTFRFIVLLPLATG